ncbi:reverse transcriptase domain-containing protein [Tanacetum coccineum]
MTTRRKREYIKPRPRSDGSRRTTSYYARKDFLDCHLPKEWEIARDAKLNPFKDTLVFRRMMEFLGAITINLKRVEHHMCRFFITDVTCGLFPLSGALRCGYVPIPENRGGARIAHGLPVQVLPAASQGTQSSAYVRKCHTLKNDGQEDIEETLDKLRRVNVKIDPGKFTFGMEEERVSSDREGGTGIGLHGKVLKDNLSEAPNKEGSRGANGEKNIRKSGTNTTCNRQEQGETSRSREMLQEEQILTSRAWRFMDYKALLAELVALAGKGMKDLHVFIDSKMLVDQVEGSRIPRTKEAKKYKEGIMDATTLFHRVQITHLPKSLNPRA